MRAYKHIPVLQVDDVMNAIPFDCVPVAVAIAKIPFALSSYIARVYRP